MTADGGNNEQWAQTAMFTASEVETQTGVPAATLRQWERRYGFPRPVRNASGYRLYSPGDVREIGIMLEHQRRGVSARLAAELTLRGVPVGHAGKQQPTPEPQPTPARAPVQTSELAHALAQALIAADNTRAGDLLAEAHAQLPVEDVMTHVMSPALVEIGALWAGGEITIAHERAASHYLRSRLSALMDIAGSEEGQGGSFGPLVVAACAPGEQHELGLMMLTLALRRRGVRVAYLGANVPLGDLTTFAHERQAQAILLGVNGEWALQGWVAGDWNGERWVPDSSSAEGAPARGAGRGRMLNGAGNALAPASSRPILQRLGLPVFLGGALMNARPELAAELGGIYAGPDATAATSIISEALNHASQAVPESGRKSRPDQNPKSGQNLKSDQEGEQP
ncbi:MerR family transcriptional regulator [Deinococcus marmoris]|uniref:Transcriptional regulator, MerR family n=1 Tax=Deinococcus marmoris TaxID=249408 RepID=A0A1U7P0C1_9DEIO|nr:B12-binding domain-containing protein [Deinococcus marmoris]OLV18616.1 Transcriptional regulator, MerR family [Deinococcus marmoris]